MPLGEKLLVVGGRVMVEMKVTGGNLLTEQLKKWEQLKIKEYLEELGKEGVEALRIATPKRTGKTSESWSYEITETSSGYELIWLNSNFNKGVNIALMIQYGHGTSRGGYVKGIDYINPALEPIFKKLGEDIKGKVVWK